jgi:hypothetical protein
MTVTDPTTHLTIDLNRIETAALVERVMRPGAVQPFGLYVFAGHDPGAELGRMVERSVFGDAFGESEELLAAEYAPYEDASIFFVVVDHLRKVPCGVVRVIVPGPAGQKTLDDLEAQWGRSLDRLRVDNPGALASPAIWDLATQAVMPDYQGGAKSGLVASAMYHGVVLASALVGAEWWIAVMDDPVLRLMNINWRRPFQRFADVPSQPYLGSASSTPAWTDFRAWVANLKDAAPDKFDMLVDLDDDPAVSMPAWQEVASLFASTSPEGTYAVPVEPGRVERQADGSTAIGERSAVATEAASIGR